MCIAAKKKISPSPLCKDIENNLRVEVIYFKWYLNIILLKWKWHINRKFRFHFKITTISLKVPFLSLLSKILTSSFIFDDQSTPLDSWQQRLQDCPIKISDRVSLFSYPFPFLSFSWRSESAIELLPMNSTRLPDQNPK